MRKTIKTNPKTDIPFKPLPPSKAWTDTLTENPVISPVFTGTLAIVANEHLHKWILANAPAEIIALYRGMETLRRYEMEFADGAGRVSIDANSSIVEAMIETINALDHVGDEWIVTMP
jgi:hypothetical protein